MESRDLMLVIKGGYIKIRIPGTPKRIRFWTKRGQIFYIIVMTERQMVVLMLPKLQIRFYNLDFIGPHFLKMLFVLFKPFQ